MLLTCCVSAVNGVIMERPVKQVEVMQFSSYCCCHCVDSALLCADWIPLLLLSMQ